MVDGIVCVVFYSFSQVSQLRVTLSLVLLVNGMQKCKNHEQSHYHHVAMQQQADAFDFKVKSWTTS